MPKASMLRKTFAFSPAEHLHRFVTKKPKNQNPFLHGAVLKSKKAPCLSPKPSSPDRGLPSLPPTPPPGPVRVRHGAAAAAQRAPGQDHLTLISASASARDFWVNYNISPTSVSGGGWGAIPHINHHLVWFGEVVIIHPEGCAVKWRERPNGFGPQNFFNPSGFFAFCF